MHPEGLSYARAEAIRLNECTHQGSDIVNPGSLHEITQCLGARLARPHLEVYEVEFIAQIRVSVVKILAHAHQGLIECQPGLDADDGQVERVGQSEANAVLPVTNHALQNEAWQQESQRGNANEQSRVRIIESDRQRNCNEPDCGRQDACAEVVVDVDGIPESRLNQPAASAGNIGR